MPIPVGRSGNVDGEGGTADGFVRSGSVVGARWVDEVQIHNRLRERMVAIGIQPERSLRWTRTTRFVRVDESGRRVFTTTLESEPWLEELTDDADSDGADGS